ncbi:hypothetical protein M3197_11380 [Sporosarcina aquimarina]|uniref:hypothetical protein n=1 Tax=Sporosarcina aquimarina TaxID=114975 RepID=UPI00204027BC|nr:hypothetical protein [Sporosarcina aquimarina]MCM3758066.1 hypothetical protein [Sporosarcina aquimarina]
MNVFFQKVEHKSNSKILTFIRVFMIIGMTFFLFMAIFNHLDLYYLMWVFLLAAVLSLVDIIVSLINKADKNVVVLEIGYAFIWIFMLVLYVLI